MFAPFAFRTIRLEEITPIGEFSAIGGQTYFFTSESITYKVHYFTSSGDFEVLSGTETIDYMIVGGGGGSAEFSGAGGAGGVLTGSLSATPQTYSFVVGDGGPARLDVGIGNAGTGSSAFGFTALGGGAGAGSSVALAGGTGGSGGGGSPRNGGAGSGTSPQGQNGGTGRPGYTSGNDGGAGGGGGFSEVGANGGLRTGGDGGDGIDMSLVFGTTIGDGGWFAGGGGGMGDSRNGTSTPGLGGNGGGGLGGQVAFTVDNTAGEPNTGGGAGGGTPGGDGKDGGSGIVALRYPVEWTPAVFSNIKAWWIADSGVTMSTADSSKVQKWTDLVGGYEVTQSFNSNPNFTAAERSPTTSSAWPDLNNQPIVRFGMTTNPAVTNAPQYMYSTGSFTALSSESYTQIIICEYISRNASFANMAPIIGQVSSTDVKRFWFDRILANGNVRNFIQLGVATAQTIDSGDLLSLGTEKVMWNQYQAGSGDTYFGMNTTTGSLEYNGATTNDTWSTATIFGINGYLVGSSNPGSISDIRANDMAVAEVILIYGEPSASEWAEFKSYVDTKYGITIS